ncbi:hypothetical protein ASPZODRAFT_162068 [Penicilliopsis zonata CBS 506.65]|uniref:Major facilitator superfamily (MFS) profile domain-containing protein n=1 Tax=Penicilliopsis zonata CBS 506.65 TaxID=1073090 RepID=A0A1L9S6U4_9EURO|nr:hypothetical protein ASPZODRAFT_162068 [Penicilliopsis zonata CBS 506.65]OJJ42879.1 hypothetical protein ASPZODRAFT_162068 [Penicilliopsis zonata CBS 506.65]
MSGASSPKAGSLSPWRDLNSVLAIVTVFGSMGAAGYGFDLGWWSGVLSTSQFARAYGKYDAVTGAYAMSSVQESIGSGTATAAVIAGLFVGTPINERLGRRMTMLIQALTVVVGVIIEATSGNRYVQLIVGRMVVYFGGGLAANVVPVYQAECAPPHLRGLMSAGYNIFLMWGGFLACLIVFLCRSLENEWAFRTVIVCQLLMPAMMACGLFLLPESPRWLIRQGRLDEARAVVRTLRRGVVDEDAEVLQLQAQLEEEKTLHAASSYLDCFRGTNLRRTIICIGPQALQQAQGISFISNYLGTFMEQLGFDSVLLILVIIYAAGCVSNIISLYTNDRLGRRPTLLVSAGVQAICMLSIGGLATHGTANISLSMQHAAIALLVIWFFSFQGTWGPLAWVICSEAPTAQLREKTVSVGALGSYASGLVITFVNPYVQDAIGGNVAFIYGSFSVVAVVFVFFVVPELKNRSLEELDEMFHAKLPTRKFRTYQTHGLLANSKLIDGPETKDSTEAFTVSCKLNEKKEN